MSEEKKLENFFKKKEPFWWGVFYPKKYSNTEDYFSPKRVAIHALSLIGKMNMFPKLCNNVDLWSSIVLGMLARYGMPAFHLKEELGEKLLLTSRPPEDIFFEIEWPLPALGFYIPKSVSQLLNPPNDETLQFIGIGKLEDKNQILLPFEPLILNPKEVKIVYFSITSKKKEESFLYAGAFSKDDPLKEDAIFEEYYIEDGKVIAKSDGVSPETLEQIKDFNLKILNLSLNLIAATLFLQPLKGETLKKEKVFVELPKTPLKKKKEVIIKQPIFLGDFSEIESISKTESTSSSESTLKKSSPRSHWRRGHWHTVLFGPKHSQRKLKWFSPVLVNPHNK